MQFIIFHYISGNMQQSTERTFAFSGQWRKKHFTYVKVVIPHITHNLLVKVKCSIFVILCKYRGDSRKVNLVSKRRLLTLQENDHCQC